MKTTQRQTRARNPCRCCSVVSLELCLRLHFAACGGAKHEFDRSQVRIAYARRTHAKELNLQNLQLTEVPAEVFYATGVLRSSLFLTMRSRSCRVVLAS